MAENQHIQELFEQYQRQRNNLVDLQQKMRSISATVVSARREVSVTVSHTGVVTEIKFPTSAYRRLTPQELASLIMKTIDDARDTAATEAAEVIAPLLPKGLNAKALMRGNADIADLAPETPRLPQEIFDQILR